MANPVLNERALEKARTTWAPPQGQQPPPGTQYFPPVSDGPVSSWQPRSMTVNGTISATATLFVLLLVTAVIGWMQTDVVVSPDGPELKFPPLAFVGVVIGFGCLIALMFKPQLAKFVAPVYAIAQGFFIGAISKTYELAYDGIVIQAAGATIAVFASMLFLYRIGVIRVTDKFRKIVIGATLGVMVLYGVSFLMRLFGAEISFLNSPSLLGIGFSVFVAGLAAMNLALDFDFIERGSRQGLDKNFEWFAAFGLLVTIVWLYLEILRLLSKLRER